MIVIVIIANNMIILIIIRSHSITVIGLVTHMESAVVRRMFSSFRS